LFDCAAEGEPGFFVRHRVPFENGEDRVRAMRSRRRQRNGIRTSLHLIGCDSQRARHRRVLCKSRREDGKSFYVDRWGNGCFGSQFLSRIALKPS
jgi:hypothetical protein